MLSNFHFLQPFWLLALLPLLLLIWLFFRESTQTNTWEKIIDSNLQPYLLSHLGVPKRKASAILISIGSLLAVIALADPVWEKTPKPVFQTSFAQVLVLDLSNSMLAGDLTPNRLARARFKVEDILAREEEGQTGLVVFAGDAFTAAPLTRDNDTIRSLLKVLSPQLMPVQGSRVDLGIEKAQELLIQGGAHHGHVLVIADGVSRNADALAAVDQLRKAGYTLSVLGVGTDEGGAISFSSITRIPVELDEPILQEIAQRGGGSYHRITTNNQDIKHVLPRQTPNKSIESKQTRENELNNTEDWQSTGPIWLLFLLPLAALAFRRGWLLPCLMVGISFGLIALPQPASAESNSWLKALTKNKAQRAQDAFELEDYKTTKDLSPNPLMRGAANYKLKNYQAAVDQFKQATGADARYNEGNSLAQLKKYSEAIEAYEKALTLEPSMQDAIDNKKAIEDFLKQQATANKQKKPNEQEQKGKAPEEKKEEKQQNVQKKSEQQENSQQQTKQGDGEDPQQLDSQQKKDQNQFAKAKEAIEKKPENENKQAQQPKESQQAQDDIAAANRQEGSLTPQKEQNEKQTDAKFETVQQKDNAPPQQPETLNKEEKIAAEQWLRRIPDDPGGLLHRKFLYLYRPNRNQQDQNDDPW